MQEPKFRGNENVYAGYLSRAWGDDVTHTSSDWTRKDTSAVCRLVGLTIIYWLVEIQGGWVFGGRGIVVIVKECSM